MVEGFKNTEVGVIPNDWEVIPLLKLSERIMVGIASAATHAYRKKGVVLFRNQNIKSGFLDDSDILYVSEEYEQIFANKRLHEGDLITARTGYPGTTCIIPKKYSGAQSFTTLITRPISNKINSEYLNHYINSEKGQSFFSANQIGGSQKNVNAGTLKKMPIAYPTRIAEQTAIATALNDADALITQLEKLIDKKRAIKQGAMQELFTPKIGWEEKTYGEVFLFLNSATYSRAQLTITDEIKYIHYGDIHTRWNYNLDIQNNSLPSIRNDQLKGYSIIKDGDVIMADASEDYNGVGKSVEVENVGSTNAIAGLHTFLLRDINSVFVNGFRRYIHVIRSVKKQFDELATGMKVYGVSKANLKNVIIPVPPIDQQIRIAQILSDMDAEIEGLEKKLEKTKKIKQGMMQELLTGRIRLI